MSASTPDTADLAARAQASLDARVLDAQTAMLYRRSQGSVLAGVLLGVVVCVGLMPYLPAVMVWGWFALRCCVALLRYMLGLRFFRFSPGGDRTWRRGFLTSLALDGLVWAMLAVWLRPEMLPSGDALMVAVLVGVASVGMFVLQSSWRASGIFVVSTLLPVIVFQFALDTRAGLFIGLALSIFLVLILLEVRHSEARIRELLRLRFDTDRIAEERAKALQMAQRQSQVKSQFLATMSHEMRTPLHGILGLTRMLRQSNGTAAPLDQLALVERAGEHLLTLINDVLDFSKLEAGPIKLAEEPFDLAALIEDVVSLSVPSAYEAGITLTTRLQMQRPCTVRGDPSRVRQVLHNLVGNAIKFTDIGSVTVTAKYHPGRGLARISVQDTGVGIAAHDLSRIFDAFHQADGSYTRRFGGTGLGLTIGRELARAMGGDLTCTSEIGKGSAFVVKLRLPVHEAASAGEVDLPLEPVEPRLAGHVLLAEDNAVNALVAEAALQEIGLTVQVVGDGEQALAAFEARRPDVVVLDCHMPVMDGFEAARRMRIAEVRQGWPRTPIVALTANALEGDRELSLAAGMDDHLAKPFRQAQLRAMLQRVMHPTD